MKANNVWPRQPCIGLALAAVVGILLADYFPSFPAGLIALLIFAALALVRQSSLATYLFVAAGFFSAHAARVIDSSGSRLAHELGDAP